MGGEWLLEPAHAIGLETRHHTSHVGDRTRCWRPRVLLDEGRRFLIAERHAARLRRNGSSGAAEQPIQWPADDLYTFPQTPTTSVAVIPTMKLAKRGIGVVGHGAWRTAVV